MAAITRPPQPAPAATERAVAVTSPTRRSRRRLLPLLGLADDGVVALWLAGAFLGETDRYLSWERAQPVIVEGTVRP